MNLKRKNPSMRRLTPLAFCMLLGTIGWVGCTPTPTEVEPPGLHGCNDLELTPPLNVYEVAGDAADGDDVVETDEPFLISWLALYHKGTDTGLGGTGDYVGSVSIKEDGVEVFYEEFDAQPIGLSGGEWDEFLVEPGLPAGTYMIRVVLDVYDVVGECEELPIVLNNVKEKEFTVEVQPIDDKVTTTGDAPENDGSGEIHRGDGQSRDPSRR